MTQKIWHLELLGIPFIVIVGSLLHFAFAWTGHWIPIAVVAAVNESVWEHLKLAFWPSIFWAALVYAWLRPSWSQFWAAKGYALLIAPLLIVSIFYTYTALVGRNLLVLDIATFMMAIAAGQIGSAILFSASGWTCNAITVGTMLLICQVIAYSTLTFYPLPFSIFKDSHDSSAGAGVLLRHEI